MQHNLFLSLLVFTMLVSQTAAASNSSRLERLADVRHELTVPPYNAQERQLLARQALFTLSQLFVHRDLKIADFGPEADPIPPLRSLVVRAPDLPSATFHEDLAKIFIGLHDLHTSYPAPRPLACASAFIPLRFASVVSNDREVVLVQGKLRVAEGYVRDIEVGTELIAVDGVDVSQHLKSLGRRSGGANDAAMRYRALQKLSMLGASTYPLPENDFITLKLSNGGTEFEKRLPWLAIVDETCLAHDDDEHSELLSHVPWHDTTRSHEFLMTQAKEDYQVAFNRVFGQPALKNPADLINNPRDINEYQRRFRTHFDELDVPLQHEVTRPPWAEIFEHTIIDTPAGRLGYIRLKSFFWQRSGLDVDTVTQAMRRILETDLQDASSLVIDVRGNPGGIIVLAERLVQLFSQTGVEPTTVRMLSNDLNADIFIAANQGENRWTQAINDANARGERYITPMHITPPTDANTIGQVWFKPVVVLTDAGCYSACDLFAAGMQDNNAGIVIGVDDTTGAGGANVMEYRTFSAIMQGAASNPFVALPSNQNMRVSWRQTLRSGASEGVLLENRGVLADKIVRLTPDDIFMGESRNLMREIHRAIEAQRPAFESGLAPIPGGLVYLANEQPGIWEEKVFGVDELRLYDETANHLTSINVAFSQEPQPIELELSLASESWNDRRITLVGVVEETPVFRVVRNLQWRGDYRPVPPEGLVIDAARGFNDLYVANLKGDESTGWQVLEDHLRVGTGPNYDPNVLTRAFLPLQLNGRSVTVAMDISVVAEALNDTLRIYVINPETKGRLQVYAGSSLPELEGASFSIPSGWNKAELYFEFESDENWNLTGPIIRRLVIR